MDPMEKRRRRIELMIDRRMVGFLKPVLTSAKTGERRRDSLEFLSPLSSTDHKHEHKAS